MEPDAALEMLMERYQQGDLSAASDLIRRLSPPLHRYFSVQQVSRSHADDLLQEAWLRIHAIRHTYRAGERVLPWLYAIARHVRVDHYRRVRRVASREQQVEEMPEPAAGRSSDSSPDIVELLTALPESQREVVVMLKFADMSLEDVARATSSSVGSVKQKAHRAYTRLRQKLEEMGFAAARSGGRDEG